MMNTIKTNIEYLKGYVSSKRLVRLSKKSKLSKRDVVFLNKYYDKLIENRFYLLSNMSFMDESGKRYLIGLLTSGDTVFELVEKVLNEKGYQAYMA